MTSYGKRSQRERIAREQAKIDYQNEIERIEKQVVADNLEMQNNLNKMCNPQKFYDLDINREIKAIEDAYENDKKQQKKDTYSDLEPISLKEYLSNFNVPKKNIIKEKFNKELKQKRINLENKYSKKYENDYLKEIENENKLKKKIYLDLLKKENAEIDIFNKSVDERHEKFKNGDKKEVELILNEYLNKTVVLSIGVENNNTEDYYVGNKVFYDEKDRSLSLELIFFSPKLFSRFPKSKKYIKRDNKFSYTYLSENEINKYYEGYLLGTSLFVIYKISILFGDIINYIYLNSSISGINPFTGKNDNVVVLSTNNTTEDLQKINIATINPKEYFRNQKARISKKMVDLIPVEPLINKIENQNIEHYSIENINYNLDGFEFEKLSKDLLLANGFDNVTVTQASGDYGADVIAYKDDIKYAVQCKKFSSKVGLKAVQEVIASKSIYKCHVAVVLTNNYFTPSAIKLAKENNVLLWDKDKLLVMIDKMKNQNK